MTPDHSSEHDFDFLIGQWRVQHRRLKARLAGCNEWQEFGGSCSMHTLLAGMGNVDDNLIDLPDGSYRAVGLRSFDARSRRWAIWWLDGRSPHSLDVPVVGAFDDEIGSFYADDIFNGQPIRVRFRWTDTQSDSPRWEQAFSLDGGETWETNWIMHFIRVPAPSTAGFTP